MASFSREFSPSSMLPSLKRSSVAFIIVLGSMRSEARLPLSAAWWRARNSSRRRATDFRRSSRPLRSSSGTPKVTTVAKARMPTNSIARKSLSNRRLMMCSIGSFLDLEVDHLAHHGDADTHPDHAGRQHQVAALLGEQLHDVAGRGNIDDAHHRQDRKSTRL